MQSSYILRQMHEDRGQIGHIKKAPALERIIKGEGQGKAGIDRFDGGSNGPLRMRRNMFALASKRGSKILLCFVNRV